MFKIKISFIIVAFCIALSGCGTTGDKQQTGKQNDSTIPVSIAGDKLYIADGYMDKLAELGLTEVAAKPYFHSPFITIAKDKSGKEYAVLFYKEGKVDKRELPVTYEEIINIFEHRNYPVTKSILTENVHLFEINRDLFWCLNGDNNSVYLNVLGHEADPFSKPN